MMRVYTEKELANGDPVMLGCVIGDDIETVTLGSGFEGYDDLEHCIRVTRNGGQPIHIPDKAVDSIQKAEEFIVFSIDGCIEVDSDE